MDKLISARQAASLFQVNPSTAERRGRKAIAAGNQGVYKLSGGYYATEEVWREIFRTYPLDEKSRPHKYLRRASIES